MRLKLVIFPLIMVAAISVFLGYIMPEYNNNKLLQTDLDTKRGLLNSVTKKKENVNTIISDLNGSSSQNRDYVLNFIPKQKNEAKLINGINNLAIDTGVSLLNISLKEGGTQTQATISSSADQVSNPLAAGRTAVDPAIPQLRGPNDPRIYSASVDFIGNYEKVKMFLEQLYRIDMYSVITAVSIAKKEQSSEDSTADPSLLWVSASVDFGYLPDLKLQNSAEPPKIFSQSSFDFSEIQKWQKISTKKIPNVELSQTGRSNPFISQ